MVVYTLIAASTNLKAMTTVSNVIYHNETLQHLLRSTVKKIKEHNTNSNISAGVGVAATVGGAGLFLTGLALAPLTLGASLGLSAVGGGLATAGAATGLGTLLVEKVLCGEELEEGQRAVNRYRDNRNELGYRVRRITFTLTYRKMTKKLIEEEILPFLQREKEELERL